MEEIEKGLWKLFGIVEKQQEFLNSLAHRCQDMETGLQDLLKASDAHSEALNRLAQVTATIKHETDSFIAAVGNAALAGRDLNFNEESEENDDTEYQEQSTDNQ